MKTTLENEHATSTFDPFNSGPLDRRLSSDDLQSAEICTPPEHMDRFLTGVKWLFLFLPGAIGLHFLMMGFSFLFFYQDWSVDIMLGSFVAFAVSAFLIMLGLGKLSDLRYLRVIAAMVAAGALASITYSLSIVFIPGDFFARFLWCSLPFTLLIGHLIKRILDTRHDA